MTFMEDKTITPREQLFIITTAIILAGLAANYSTTRPSIILAQGYARDILDNILDGKKL